jgi:hypothetical protein
MYFCLKNLNMLRFLAVFSSLFILASCASNFLDIDVEDQNVSIDFIQLDSLMFKADSKERLALHQSMQSQIPHLYEYNLAYCLKFRGMQDSIFTSSIQQFYSDPYINKLEQRLSMQFNNTQSFKVGIIDGFKHLKYHFPKGKIPSAVVFMNSLFTANAFCTETEIGIGLERYLPMKTDVIQQLPPDQFYNWIKEGFDERYIVRDALCSWVMTHYVDEVKGNLIENCIYWGKILYLTKAALPELSDALLLRYSDKDFNWALENESQLWNYLVKDKVLFKIDERMIRNLITEGPFSVGLPEEGPDRLGQFLGYRIVQKYMEIEQIPLNELLNKSYTDILVEYEID